MKTILRAIFINLITLYIVNLSFPGISVDNTLKNFVFAAFVWTILNKIIKPIIKLLLLPINLITLGLFGWVVNVATLFLLQSLTRGVTIKPFVFSGFNYSGFIIPQISFNLFFAYILTSLTLSLTHSTIKWLLKSSQ